MAVLINFKICDNAKECGGVEVCPTGALSWDEENQTIKIDNEKCIACGACMRCCPIGAIHVARTEEEYKKIQAEIDADPRTVKDLFVDRYGASPLSEYFMISPEELDSKISDELTLIECYEDDSIECLIKSIPIKDITADMPSNTKFYKVSSNDSIKKKYNISEYPSLLLFKGGDFIGKVSGYYSIEQKDEFMHQIRKILKQK